MAVTVKNKKGQDVTLLNPSEKGGKFATELNLGIRLTNDGLPKNLDASGKPSKLTGNEASYRMGYLAAQKDSAKAFKARQKKKGK